MAVASQHRSALTVFTVLASVTLVISSLVVLDTAAEPCAGTVRPVAYAAPPEVVTSLPVVGLVGKTPVYWDRSPLGLLLNRPGQSTSTLGFLEIRFEVESGRVWEVWRVKSLRDAALCPNSDIPVDLPTERTDHGELYSAPPWHTPAEYEAHGDVEPTRLSLLYDRDRDTFVVATPRGRIAGAFQRSLRPIRFYPSRARLAQLGALCVAGFALFLAWRILRVRNHVAIRRARVALIVTLTFSGLALLILGLSRFTSLQM